MTASSAGPFACGQGEFLDPGMNIYSFSFYLLGTVYVPVYHRSRAAINSAAACAPGTGGAAAAAAAWLWQCHLSHCG
eukprot:COSAG06_NODE_1992_length_7894_cov_7.031174_5_plen_77_part_00